ncbi:hypothetical protein [Kitasatospora sp. NPDC087314]|uniref:hypothetical protein n=1 Tax=Kitasatospora sp. NPDC087314 TaxID=3364068 RepID=UPI0037FC12CF
MTTTEPPPAPPIKQAPLARQERTRAMLDRIQTATERMLKAGTAISTAAVARESGASRTFRCERPNHVPWSRQLSTRPPAAASKPGGPRPPNNKQPGASGQ